MGNLKANAIANPDETRHPPPTSTSEFADRDSEIEKYIRKKWERGEFRAKASVAPRTRKPSADVVKIKTTPLPELPTMRTEEPPRPPVFGSNGRLAAKKHVESNWDDLLHQEPMPRPTPSQTSSKGRLSAHPVEQNGRSTTKAATPLPAPAPPPRTGQQQQQPPTLVDISSRVTDVAPPPVIIAQPQQWQQQTPAQSSWQQSTPSNWQQPYQQPTFQPAPANPFNAAQFTGYQQPLLQQTTPFPLSATSPYSQFSNNNTGYFASTMQQQPQTGMFVQNPAAFSQEWPQQQQQPPQYGMGGMPMGWAAR